jgi:steroid 5-alpha reductase family enzyme
MPIGYLEALAGIAVSLSILMTMAWMVQQRTGNSGRIDTIWTFSVGLTGAASGLRPLGGAAPNAGHRHSAARTADAGSRSERYRDYQSRTSPFFPLPPHKGVVT